MSFTSVGKVINGELEGGLKLYPLVQANFVGSPIVLGGHRHAP